MKNIKFFEEFSCEDTMLWTDNVVNYAKRYGFDLETITRSEIVNILRKLGNPETAASQVWDEIRKMNDIDKL